MTNNIERYNLLRREHPNDNKRGGVCMYFQEHLPILRREDLCNLRVFGNWNKDRKKRNASSRVFTDLQARVLASLIHSVLTPICIYLTLMI